MRSKLVATLGAAAAVATLATAASGPAQASQNTARTPKAQKAHCAAQFERAQRTDMTSFRDYDAKAFRRGHDPAAVSIFPQGQRFVGINAIMDALDSHFTDKEAIWAWTELNRRVQGCKWAYIEYDATYDIPSANFHQRALTVVTYSYEHGRWLGVMDQGTLLELTTGADGSS